MKIPEEGHLVHFWGSGMHGWKLSMIKWFLNVCVRSGDSWMCVYLPGRDSHKWEVPEARWGKFSFFRKVARYSIWLECLVSDETGEVSWGQTCSCPFHFVCFTCFGQCSVSGWCLSNSWTSNLMWVSSVPLYPSGTIALWPQPHSQTVWSSLRELSLTSQLTLVFPFLKSVLIQIPDS